MSHATTASRSHRSQAFWFFIALVFLLTLGMEHRPRVAAAGSDAAASRPVESVDLGAIEQAFERVIRDVQPSVVGIRVERHYFSTPTAEAPPVMRHVSVNGSGMVIGADGLILTNDHVVNAATSINVVVHDGRVLAGELVASDARADLAVLRVDAQDLEPVRWCQWSSVRRGQWAVALGNPYGLGGDGSASVSIGVVANLGRRLPGLGDDDDRLYSNMIQTTASINPGNSGGPLFNVRGEAIGVVTAVYTRAGADEGVGFAIPLTFAKRAVIEQLARGQAVEYGYLGVALRNGVGDAEAAPVVVDVEVGGPGDRAGLEIGDVVLRCGDAPVATASEMAEFVGAAPVGTPLMLEVDRDGRRLMLNAVVERREVSRVAWMRGEALQWRGARIALLDDASPSALVVVDVETGSPAADAHLAPGDVIEAAAGRAVRSLAEFDNAVRDHSAGVTVAVRGRGDVQVSPS